MTAPIRRRLDALERSDEHEQRGPFVVIVRTGLEPVGAAAPHPSRLDVLRLPGETWDALAVRVAPQFRNSGRMVVYMPANGRE